MKQTRCLLISMLLAGANLASGGQEVSIAQKQEVPVTQKTEPEDENSRDLFTLESTYTLSSDFRGDEEKLGDGDSIYSDISYAHRFLIKGNWFFRAGVEYERYTFADNGEGLPDHLQSIHGQLAIEYVVHDHAGAGLELDPGFYFQDRITRNAFDSPVKLFVSFPLKKDKIFGVIGVGAALYQDPPVAPGGGIIWLFSDQLRLEGVFPKPALVWQPSDDWELRALGELSYESYRTDDVITPMHKLQTHNAVVQYNEDRAGVTVSYTGLKPFKITAGGGYTVERDFDFFRHGVQVKADPSPYFTFMVDARF